MKTAKVENLNRKTLYIAIILLIISALIMSCIIIDDPGGPLQPTQSHPFDPAYATATYGAEQYHLQLTALATETP